MSAHTNTLGVLYAFMHMHSYAKLPLYVSMRPACVPVTAVISHSFSFESHSDHATHAPQAPLSCTTRQSLYDIDSLTVTPLQLPEHAQGGGACRVGGATSASKR